MTERDFLTLIHADPDEPETYLVYADWLEEQGETARGGLIRAQVELEWSQAGEAEQTARYALIDKLQPQVKASWAAYKKWEKMFSYFQWKYGLPWEATSRELPSLRRLRALPELFSLTTLNTGWVPAPEAFAVLVERSSLHTIAFCHANASGSDFEALARLPSLQGLNFSYAIADADLERLAPLQDLRSLYLGESPITDAGLAGLAPFRRLERLALWQAEIITDAGLEHLRGLKHLKELILHDASITDAGLERLSGLKELTHLDLARSPNVTAAALDTILKFKKLRRLNLDRVPGIDDACVLRLAKLPELRVLDLGRTNATRYNLGRALAKFPKLKRICLEERMDGSGEEKEVAAFRKDMEEHNLFVDVEWE